MGRILAIDYGKKRVGLAVTDMTGIIASGLATVPVRDIWDYLDTYISGQPVVRIVIGYPKTLMNEPSECAVLVEPFYRRMMEKYPAIPVDLMDERFTSVMAQQTLIEAGAKKKDRKDKSRRDMISAVIILQSYLAWLKKS